MIVDVFVGRFLHEHTAPKVNQFDLHGVLVHQQVLWVDDTMEDPALTANVSGVNHLPHNVSCCALVEASSVELHETQQVHARLLRDHDVVVNYLRNVGARLKEKKNMMNR